MSPSGRPIFSCAKNQSDKFSSYCCPARFVAAVSLVEMGADHVLTLHHRAVPSTRLIDLPGFHR